jgi:hypothetical protein
MMQGGINNAALFGASQRSARSKLDQMAGIKRPSGILASSPELMQAAMPYQPPMPQSPASMVGAPMAPPMMDRLPYMPMPTSVAPRSLNPMAPDPVVPQPASPNTPMRFKPGGDVSVAPDDARRDQQLRVARQSLDITMDSGKFKSFLKGLPYLGVKFLEETIGDEAAIAQVAQRKLNNIEAAAKSKDPAQTADQVMVEAGEKPTAAAKMDFAKNVLGLDINDIDEINRRIDNVVVGSAVGKGPDEFAAAVLMGLQAFKQTASARAAGASGSGSNFTKDRTALRAYQDTLDSLTRSLSDRDLPADYKGSVADYAAEQALKQVLKTYPANQIPPQLLAQGGGQPQVQPQVSDDGRITMYDPTGKPFYSTDGTNFVDADGNPYATPTQE